MLIPKDKQIELMPQGEAAKAYYVSKFLAARFEYVADQEKHGPFDSWPPRTEIEENLADDRIIQDDCDGHAFAAVYALADLGIKARVLIGYVWAPVYVDGQEVYRWCCHMVCETESGLVIDNMELGQVDTWNTLFVTRKFIRDRMSGFFEFAPEQVAAWHYIVVTDRQEVEWRHHFDSNPQLVYP